MFSDKLWRETRVPETFLIRTTGGMRKWRLDVEHAQCGIDLPDDLPKLLGLRFAACITLRRYCAQNTFPLGKFDARICKSGSFAEPPSNLDGSRPWHEILQNWSGNAQSITLEHGMKLWSHPSRTHYWKLTIVTFRLMATWESGSSKY